MNATEFVEVVKRVQELWAGRAFVAKWNEACQHVTFKSLSYFRQDEVLEALEHHKYDNQDAREPRFGEIRSKLWAVKKGRQATNTQAEFSGLPSLCALKIWVDGKSDADLAHLWSIVEQRWGAKLDIQEAPWSWVRAFREDRPRGPTEAVFCYAAERNVDLAFGQGSDEWSIVMHEYGGVAKLAEARQGAGRWNLDEWAALIRAA